MKELDPRVAVSHPKHLCNQLDRDQLIEKLDAEDFERKSVSFYRYVNIEDPKALRHEIFTVWNELQVNGRVYLATEGVNAQISVPDFNFEKFCESADHFFPQIKFKVGREEDGDSFYKLIIKSKSKILADGQDDGSYDVTNVGKHLTAKQWNEAMSEEDTIVVDIRNHYESEIGHFSGAMLPDVDSFREELPVVKKMLEGKEESKVLLYCTGGIRCEKTSAWLKNLGYKDVNQLHGGIIDYDRQVKDEGLENKFIGKNFVFDGRMSEKITDDVIAQCHTCDEPADTHINCAWQVCHVLFIQCEKCQEKLEGCCSDKCVESLDMPEDQQLKLRQDAVPNSKTFNKGRFRASKEFAL
jgi:UPF0176 protein